MVTYGRIQEVISKIISFFGIGGLSRGALVSPKGLYSKPKKSDENNALVFPVMGGDTTKFIMPTQEHVDLKNGDVLLTDNKSKIRFDHSTGSLIVDSDSIVFNCKSIKFNGCTITNDGVDISKTHKHDISHTHVASDGVYVHIFDGVFMPKTSSTPVPSFIMDIDNNYKGSVDVEVDAEKTQELAKAATEEARIALENDPTNNTLQEKYTSAQDDERKAEEELLKAKNDRLEIEEEAKRVRVEQGWITEEVNTKRERPK